MIHSPTDPIAALATPAASSALAVIRVSGQGSLEILSRLVAPPRSLAALSGHTIHRCRVRDGEEDVDDVMIAVYRAPRSYTGEDGAEIFCHGSIPVIQRILSLLRRSGFREAGPGEFTQRAFLNGRMDLTRAEAVNEIVRARTDRARGLALRRLSGAVEERARGARDALIDIRASLEASIDYPEDVPEGAGDGESLAAAKGLIDGLLNGYRQGRVYQEGASVAIAGATNAGKSRLFNALLGQDRAIVSDVHGTTRDWLEATVSIDGVPIRLFDTAGIRTSSDPLEAEGMRRTEDVVAGADLVIYLVDGTRGLSDEDRRVMDAWRSRSELIPAWNKTDLSDCLPAPDGFFPVSAATGEGLPGLRSRIGAAVLGSSPSDSSEPLICSDRQRGLLERARAAIGRYEEARGRGVTPDLLAV
ncbi:MAG TPA: tRNA uridine-5-carboxymethylaminomethyl(34) synthesis GTPase MnmE, partial [Spirochaetia bacterium]